MTESSVNLLNMGCWVSDEWMMSWLVLTVMGTACGLTVQ